VQRADPSGSMIDVKRRKIYEWVALAAVLVIANLVLVGSVLHIGDLAFVIPPELGGPSTATLSILLVLLFVGDLVAVLWLVRRLFGRRG